MYFIKITAVATEKNENFFGETHIYLYGKKEALIETQGSKSLRVKYSPYFAREYGYKRRCDAERGLKSHLKFFKINFPYWSSTAEIVEINV